MADIRVMRDDLLPPKQPPRRHLISIADLTRGRRLAPARHRAQLRALARARGEEAADAPRPDDRQPLLRVVDAHVVELRARGEASLRRHDVDQELGLVGRQGRIAEGHGAHARRLRPGRDRDPAPAHRRAAARRARDARRTSSTPATASTSIRRRRCSTSTRSTPSSGASTACTSRSSATSCTRASRARTSRRSR